MRTIGNKTAGFSLMEMLISIVIGMIIVVAASTMLVNILKSQKDIAASASLNQELGAVMAVMSNEIRRAGFSVCDETAYTCKDAGGNPFVTYSLGEDIKIDSGGDCIVYRYNADLNGDANTSGEHRGFRINNITNTIQIGDATQNVACTDSITSTKWIDLTDPNVVNMTALSFSTTGSKCRNMSRNFYWVVGGGAVGLACDDNTTPIVGCTDLNIPPISSLSCDSGDTNVETAWVNDTKETLFGVNNIRIILQATLTRDPAVSKTMQTSVKVANPWVRPGIIP